MMAAEGNGSTHHAAAPPLFMPNVGAPEMMMKKMGWIVVGFSAATSLAAAGLTIHLGWCTWYAGWDDGLSDLVEDLGLKTMWAGALPLVAVALMAAGVALITRKREK